MRTSKSGLLLVAIVIGFGISSMPCAIAQGPPNAILREGQGFALNDNIVSTSVFLWYGAVTGQLDGAWEPLGGRPSWTGTSAFWKSQIKEIMSANIDTLNVHLLSEDVPPLGYKVSRTNFFQAMSDLRSEGYNVPKVTPFFDGVIETSVLGITPDLATVAGKDFVANPYIDFYNQYYSVNTDAFADSYLTKIDNRTALDIWHTNVFANPGSLTKADLQTRLQTEFAAQHPNFNNDIYMTATQGSDLSFEDEQVVQFQSQNYYDPTTFNGLQTVQLKPGYWDQNIRTPGDFLARDGGTNFSNAWNQVIANKDVGIGIDRVYIESWNEYDESTGIYAAEAQPPIIGPLNPGTHTDTWSNTNNPREYIDTTAEGARQFNETPDLDSTILWHNIPTNMRPGETFIAKVVVRNDGDLSWTGADNYKLGQNELIDAQVFGPGRTTIDDATNEIPTYGGVFRGRPITFNVEVTAPAVQGNFTNHWQMLQEGNARFGEEITQAINVSSANAPNNILFNGDFEIDPEGTTAGGTDVIDSTTITGWRAFGVGGATGIATVTSAAGQSGKGIELVRTSPVGADSAFDKDDPSLRETILPEERIYKLTLDARDGSQFGGTNLAGALIQFANTGFNRATSFNPGANFETFGVATKSDTGGQVSVRLDLGGTVDSSVQFDNVTLVDATTGVNRMINGSFENSTTSLRNWRFFDQTLPNGAGSATLSGDANSGASAVLLDVSNTPFGDIGLDTEPERIPTIAGEDLRLSFSAKNVSAPSADTRLRVSMAGHDASGALVTDFFAELVDPGTGAYGDFLFDFTVPANVSFINLGFRVWDEITNQLSTGSYLIDDISVLRLADDADFDADGDVDGADFLTWQRNFSSLAPTGGDANNDGIVDAADLAVWESTFGSVTPLSALAAGSVAVPEPSTALQLVILALILVGYSRGRIANVSYQK